MTGSAAQLVDVDRPAAGSHAPRPERGQLISCLIPAHHDGQELYEVWCHPDDTAELLDGGIRSVNGRPARAFLVDRQAHADTLRITCAINLAQSTAKEAYP